MDRETFLAQLRALARPRGGKGRPRADRMADIDTGMRRFSLMVYVAARAEGYRYGAITKATRQIAKHHGIKYGSLKRAVTRNSWLRDVAKLFASIDRENAEIHELGRRLGDIREDSIITGNVWRLLSTRPYKAVLRDLRDADINGQCPKWLIDLADDLMSPNPSHKQ